MTLFSLTIHRYKRPDGSTKTSQTSAQSGTGKGCQKNAGIGFDSRSCKGKSKVHIFPAKRQNTVAPNVQRKKTIGLSDRVKDRWKM